MISLSELQFLNAKNCVNIADAKRYYKGTMNLSEESVFEQYCLIQLSRLRGFDKLRQFHETEIDNILAPNQFEPAKTVVKSLILKI